MAKKKNIVFEDVLDDAILEGFAEGVVTYMAECEETFQNNVVITESGGLENVIKNLMQQLA
jgi:hypothetical protein